jgi:hypothetical protein
VYSAVFLIYFVSAAVILLYLFLKELSISDFHCRITELEELVYCIILFCFSLGIKYVLQTNTKICFFHFVPAIISVSCLSAAVELSTIL